MVHFQLRGLSAGGVRRGAAAVYSLVEEVQVGKLSVCVILIGKTGITRWVFNLKELQLWRARRRTDRAN